MKYKRLALSINTWRIHLILRFPIVSTTNLLQDKNSYSVRQRFPLCLVLGVLFMLGKPTVGLATMCAALTPDETIQSSNLIFKGKVIDVKLLIDGKIIINDEIEKIWFRRPFSLEDKALELKAHLRPQFNNYFWEHFNDLRYLTKYAILTSYKGPAFATIEVKSFKGLHYVGEEETVFAVGKLKEGYSSYQCNGFSYWWASDKGDPSYQAALDGYRIKREQLTTALQSSPHNAALLKAQGKFYLQYHDFDSAEWAYWELRLHYPEDVAGLVGLANVKFDRAQHKSNINQKALYEQALAGYEAILKIDPNNRAVRHSKILALLYLGRWSEVDKNARDFSGYLNEENHEKSIDFFAGKNLAGANFRNAKLSNFNFSKADLHDADFSGASLINCDFTGATLDNAKFHNLHESYKTKFIGAKLQHADFKEAKIEEVDFSKADLRDADFSKATLEASQLAKAKLNNAKFRNAKVCGTDATTWPTGFDLHRAGVKTCK